MSIVKKTVKKNYKKKFSSSMSGISAGLKSSEKEIKPGFGLAQAAAAQKQQHNTKNETIHKKVEKTWHHKKNIFKKHSLVKSKTMSGMSAGIEQKPQIIKSKTSDIKIDLGDFASILKTMTGKGMDLGDLENLVKKFTGGDIHLSNIKDLFENVTGEKTNINQLGNVVKKITGHDISVTEPVKLGKGGGLMIFIIIGIVIYILLQIF